MRISCVEGERVPCPGNPDHFCGDGPGVSKCCPANLGHSDTKYHKPHPCPSLQDKEKVLKNAMCSDDGGTTIQYKKLKNCLKSPAYAMIICTLSKVTYCTPPFGQDLPLNSK